MTTAAAAVTHSIRRARRTARHRTWTPAMQAVEWSELKDATRVVQPVVDEEEVRDDARLPR